MNRATIIILALVVGGLVIFISTLFILKAGKPVGIVDIESKELRVSKVPVNKTTDDLPEKSAEDIQKEIKSKLALDKACKLGDPSNTGEFFKSYSINKDELIIVANCGLNLSTIKFGLYSFNPSLSSLRNIKVKNATMALLEDFITAKSVSFNQKDLSFTFSNSAQAGRAVELLKYKYNPSILVLELINTEKVNLLNIK